MVHRAHHALPPMSTSSGEPTAALYGFASLLVKLLRERAPSGVALAFDAGARRRRTVHPGYKASRRAPPPELARQLERVRDLPAVIGAPRLEVPGEEADDVLATAARVLDAAGQDALVVSGDRDLLQLCGPRVRVIFIGRRAADHVDYDEAAVRARFGVAPAALPTLRAFLGDPADELPGLAGVGPRTAARWVEAHGSIDAIVARAAELRPAHLGALLAAAADTLRRVESLGRLVADLPIGPPPHHAPWDDAARDRLRAWFEQLEFRSLIARLPPPPAPP